MMHQPCEYSEYFGNYTTGPRMPMSGEWLAAVAPPCRWCGHEFDKWEAECPRLDDDGDPICDETYHEHFEFTCHWCEEYEDMRHHCEIGSLFIVWEPTPASNPIRLDGVNRRPSPEWYDDDNRVMLPGVYRITTWPLYGDCVLDAWLYADAFEWVCGLPETGGGYGGYPCGPLCRECSKRLANCADKRNAA